MRQLYSFKLREKAESGLKCVISSFALFLLFTLNSVGQIGYSFTPSSGSFDEISGMTIPVIGDADMGFYNGIDIGFTFNFNGTDYTTISASTKGWMTFGQDISDCQFDNYLTSGGTRPVVAPLWDDIALNAETDFSFITEGDPGSQIFTAQWLNAKWDYMATGPVISFQVKLYEATGIIQFIYRPESEVINYGSASIGLTATGTGINNFISLQSTDASATASTTVENTSLSDKPATGQVFSFNPVSGPEIVLSSSDPAIAPGNLFLNTTYNVLYRLDISVTQAITRFTGLQVTTGGSHVAADLTNLRVYYSADPFFTLSDSPLARKSTYTGPGLHSFTFGSGRDIQANTTAYIFIVSDVPCTAVGGNTVFINDVTPSDVTFTTGSVSGTTYAGGVQTFQDVTPLNVTGPSAASGGTSALLTWTNPAGCSDEVMIIAKAGSSITGVPAGDGSSYTADLVFGNGTAFDGGFVVYKGKTSPQTLTALTAGSTYYFRFFTRKGSLWSEGIEISVTLAPVTSGDFRSAGNGSWNATSTWQYFDGSSWVPAGGTPDTESGSITILNGHTVTVTAIESADQLTINAGGTLVISSGFTFTIGSGSTPGCTVNGTMTNVGTVTGGTLVFNGTAIYRHNRNGGSIPTATWNAGSTCRVTGVTNQPPGGRSQAFSNFIWDCVTQSTTISLGGLPANISGTFTLLNSGTTFGIRLGGDVTYANYLQTGGICYILNSATPRTVNVTNFTLQGGTFQMSDVSATTGTLNVSGNFTFTGGTITESRDNRGHIVFNGNGAMQTYASTRAIDPVTIDLTVNAGAYLQMANDATIVNGSGTFTLSPGATLGITSLNGIAATGTIGNIQTRTRVFSMGANYLYNRSGSQYSGTGLPSTAITGNITVATGTVVETTSSIIADGTLTVNGSLLPGMEYYTISGSGTLTGTGRLKVNRISDSPEFLAQYTISNMILTDLTVEYNVHSGGQIISSTTYGHLRMNNTSGENMLFGTAVVTGTMTTSTGVFTIDPTGFLTAATLTNDGILNITVQGKASVNNLVNNGTIYMSSISLSEYASLVVDNYSGSGLANVEMYLTGGGTEEAPKWHYVAVPQNFSNTDVFTGINIYNLMRYDDSFVIDQSDPLTVDNGFVWWDNYDGKGGFSTLETGQGYSFYHTEDVTVYFSDLTSLETTIGTLPLQWSGANRQYPQYYGYNILGNSLTCGLDWNLVTETGNVSNTIYYLVDYDIASYVRNVGGINGGSKDIPPLQGFMVKAYGPGASLNFSAAREHTTQPRYKKGSTIEEDVKSEKVDISEESIPMVKLELNKNGNEDETLVWFSENATTAVEGDYDAVKLSYETGSDIYTMSGTTKLGINGLPLPETEALIPLTVRLKEQSRFMIVAQKIQNLDEFNVTLIDKYSGNAEVDLRTNNEYSFASAPGTYADRFVLKISKLATPVDDITIAPRPFNIFAFNNILNIKLLESMWEGKQATVSVYDLTGNKLFVENKVEWSNGDLKQFSLNLKNGVYIVEIKTEKEIFVSKINLF